MASLDLLDSDFPCQRASRTSPRNLGFVDRRLRSVARERRRTFFDQNTEDIPFDRFAPLVHLKRNNSRQS
jgi:hypothetical protein